MRIVAMIQARMGSSRLPGKVLKDIAGRSMLARVVSRSRRSKKIDDFVVATSTEAQDDALVKACADMGVAVFRGSESDVLERYYQAALTHRAEAIVRITADCPLIDPEIIDVVTEAFLKEGADYASTSLERTYPRGLDTEVISLEALTKAREYAKEFYERSHVTPYIYEHPQTFKLLTVKGNHDYSDYRWTVDTAEDLTFVREIYRHMTGRDFFGWQSVIQLLERQPQLCRLNASVTQKPLHQG